MSKELEAFRDILGILSAVSGCEVDMNSERIITVKSVLQRLESIDNSNPSEALECLERIGKYPNYVSSNEELMYDKLGKLEDLEEELGCPIEVYVKLHQQMKFYRLNALDEIIECEIDNPNDDEVYHIQADGIIFNQYDYGWQFYPFKDYKKTWWLREDKSE